MFFRRKKYQPKRRKLSFGYILTITLVGLLVLLPVVYSLLTKTDQAEAAWFDDQWRYRKKITINDSQVAGTTNFTNFPVLVSITDTAIGGNSQTDGDDILFTDINGNKLDHEIEVFDSGTGLLTTWVRVPTLYAQADTIIYVYYSNADAQNQENPGGVWGDTYAGVFHLNEDLTDEASTTDVHLDSTNPGDWGDQIGNVETTGQIYNAQDFDGSNDRIAGISDYDGDSLADSEAFNVGDTEDLVISGWFNRDVATSSDTIVAKRNSLSNLDDGWMVYLDGTTDSLYLEVSENTGADEYNVISTTTFTTTGWNHFVVVWDQDSAAGTEIYINGVDDNASKTGTIGNIGSLTNTDPVGIGAESNGGTYFDGKIDEIRVTKTIPSNIDNLITTEYNNQSAPGTFVTVGALEVTTAPIAHWKFNEGVDNQCTDGTSDVCDTMSSGIDLARTNATWKTGADCVEGSCLYFDGTGDYVSVSDRLLLDSTGASLTWNAWIKHIPQTSGQDVIMAKYETVGADGGYKVLMESDGDITCALDTNNTSFPEDSVTSTAATYDDNQWHMVTCVKDATNLQLHLYIDGVFIGSDTSITGSGQDNNDAFYIGIDGDGSSNGWDGYIDDVRVFRYAQSATQIKTTFNSRSGVKGIAARLGESGDSFGSIGPSFLNDALLAYWKMDDAGIDAESETITDSSGNAKSGTLFGDNASGDNGTGMDCTAVSKFHTGCDLDGTDDYISTAAIAMGGNTGSVAAWVNFDTLTTNGAIFQRAYQVDGLELVNDGGNFARFNVGGTACADSTTSLTAGTWYHVAGVYDGTKITVYVNGTPVTTCAKTGDWSNEAEVWGIGTDHGTDPGNFFDGTIDDLRVFDTALSPADVDALYNWAPGPMLYYKLDENTGTTANDIAAVGPYNGTLTGFDATTSWQPGKFGSATNHDGTNDHILLTTPAFRNTFKSFSVSQWVYVNSLSGANAAQHPLFFNLNGQDLYPRAYIEGDGDISLQLKTGGSTQSLVLATSATAGTWMHIGFTFNGETNLGEIYLNGVRRTSTTFTAGTLDGGTTGNFLVGGDTNLAVYLAGKMDDFRVYYYPRSADQMIEDMNGGHPMGGSPVGSYTAKWAMDEANNQDIYDQKNTYNGYLGSNSISADTNDPTWALPNICKINGCLDFDGSDDYGRVTDNAAFDLDDGEDMSITGWFNRDTFTSTHVIMAKKGDLTATTTGYALYIDATTDQLIFQIGDGIDGYTVTSTSTFTSTGWNHFALVFDESSATNTRMYINGKDDSPTKSGTLSSIGALNDASFLAFGAENDGGNPFDGKLDELTFYAGTLSYEEVKVDYNASSGVNFGTGTVEKASIIDGAGNNPMVYWTLDENTGTSTYDKSGNGNVGVGTSIAEANWEPGKVGSSYHFDTGDYFNDGFDPPAEGTVSFWMYSDDAPAATERIFGVNDLFEVRFPTTSILNFDLGFSSSGSTCITPSAVASGVWLHITALYSTTNDTCKIYINGDLVTSISQTQTDPASGTLYIGRSSTAEYFDGKIDEFKIYDYELSNAQIQYDYNRGKPFAHWKFDDCQGLTAYDASGNGLHGTITIATGTYTSAGNCLSGTSTHAWYGGATGKRNASIALDSSGDVVDVYSSSFNTLFDGDAGTVTGWAKIASGAQWTDGTTDTIFQFRVDANNEIELFKHTTDNTLRYRRIAAAGARTGDFTTSTTDWFHFAITWDHTANEQRYYFNGVLFETDTSGGSFTGNLSSTETVLGSTSTTPASSWAGQLDDIRVYNYALSTDQVLSNMNNGSASFAPSTGSP